MNKRSDIIDIAVSTSKLLLSDNLIEMLHAKPGDRIDIQYRDKDGILVPIIVKASTGNLLSKLNAIPFRGQRRSLLGQFGSNFWASEKDGVIELEGDGVPIYTDVKKAIETFITKDIIQNTNYNITKLNTYEF